MKAGILLDMLSFKPVFLKPQLKDVFSELNDFFIRILKFCILTLLMIFKTL